MPKIVGLSNPQWILSSFWPLIFANGRDPAEFVAECLTLPNSLDLILPGCVDTSLFKGPPNTPILALGLEFH